MWTKLGADAQIASAGAAYWWKVQTELGLQWRAVAVPRPAADGGLGVVDRGPPVPACHAVPWTPYRGGASTYALGASESRSQIDDTSHAYNFCSSIQLLNINATSYDLFCNAVFYAYAQLYRLGRKHYVFGLSVHLCVCAYVQTEAFSDRLAVDFHSCN